MKKISIVLASLVVVAGLAMGTVGEASAAAVPSRTNTLMADGTIFKNDVVFNKGNQRVTKIDEHKNYVEIFSYYTSTQLATLSGITVSGLYDSERNGESELDEAFFSKSSLYWVSVKGRKMASIRLKDVGIGLYSTVTINMGHGMPATDDVQLKDNVSHLLYTGDSFQGGVKVDYRRCVTAENYLKAEAEMGEGDVLECRWERDTSTGEEWYQPYLNGEKLEFTENDKASWVAAAKAEAEKVNQVWQIAGYSADDGSGGGSSDSSGDASASSSDGASASSSGAATAKDGATATKSEYQNGYEKGYADGVAEAIGSSTNETLVGSGGELVGSSVDALAETSDNSDGSASKDVEVPLLGGECAEWPWWWVIVAAICGLGVGGAGGYRMGRKQKRSEAMKNKL